MDSGSQCSVLESVEENELTPERVPLADRSTATSNCSGSYKSRSPSPSGKRKGQSTTSAQRPSKLMKAAIAPGGSSQASRSRAKGHLTNGTPEDFAETCFRASKNLSDKAILTGIAKLLVKHLDLEDPSKEALKKIKALERELEGAKGEAFKAKKAVEAALKEKETATKAVAAALKSYEDAASEHEREMEALRKELEASKTKRSSLKAQCSNLNAQLEEAKEAHEQAMTQAKKDAQKALEVQRQEYNDIIQFELKNIVDWLRANAPSLPLEQCPSLKAYLKVEARKKRALSATGSTGAASGSTTPGMGSSTKSPAPQL